MRYSTEPRFRKYVKGYGFLSFARKFGNKYGKNLMDAAKTASKRVVQKTAEATGDLIGNKIADKITSIGKPKEKKEKKQKKFIFRQKKDKLLMILDCFKCNFIERKMWHYCIKWNFKKLQIFSIQLLMIKIYQDLLLKMD